MSYCLLIKAWEDLFTSVAAGVAHQQSNRMIHVAGLRARKCKMISILSAEYCGGEVFHLVATNVISEGILIVTSQGNAGKSYRGPCV